MNAPIHPHSASPASPQQTTAFQFRAQLAPAHQVLSRVTALSPDVLNSRLREIELREPILRTSLVASGDNLWQEVRSEAGAQWLDPLELADADVGGQIAAVAKGDCLELDPARGRNLLARLLTSGEGSQVLLTASAEISDRASLLALSEELSGDKDRAVSNGTVEYADYAARRRAQLQGTNSESAVGVLEALLPASDQRGTSSALTRVQHVRALASDTFGLAPGSSIPALWAAYLARLCGAGRTTVLVRLDGRQNSQAGGAFGPYEQYLPIVYEYDGEEAPTTYLQRGAGLYDNLLANQDHVTALPRTAAMRLTSVDILELRGRSARCVGSMSPHASVDLHVEIAEGGIQLIISADGSRFSASDLERWADGFVEFVTAALLPADATLASLPCSGNVELSLLEQLGRGGQVDQPTDVVKAFCTFAAQAGTKLAAMDDVASVTYNELDAMSDAVAAALLKDARFHSGRIVPMIAAPSIEFLCGALGALKAGLAFAPLDPAHPPERTRTLLAALGTAPVLTGRGPAGQPVHLFDHIPIEQLMAAKVALPEPVRVDGTALAYVIFTSGSTGKPKGVRVTRAGLSNYLQWAGRQYRLDDPDGALVHTSPAVDLTITGLFGPLVSGGSVHLPGSRDAFSWAQERLGESGRIGLLKTTPSLLRALLKGVESAHIRVGSLVLGGEQLTGRDLEYARERLLGTRIYNEYGPTETVVGSTVFDATDWKGSVGAAVPIGTAIENTQLAVVDALLQPVPFGAPGELLITGSGVAAGYLSATPQAEQRFVSCNGRAGYRTGDLVHWDGLHGLKLLGRIDDEMKVNGVRCHPAEVEAALEALDGVSAAVVALRRDAEGRERLVAWYVPSERETEVGALREQLARVLPAALVPAVFAPVAQIPQTAAGKRDRSVLALPESGTKIFEAAQGHHEEVLAAVLASVLGVERVGREDDYFALGGDSLRSVQASALARKRGLDVSVAQIHAAPRLKDLAEIVRQGDPLLDRSPTTQPFELISDENRALMADEIDDAYPLNLLQEGMIYHRDFAPKSAVYHAICSYTIRARLDVSLMRQVINDLVRRHPLLRTSFDLTSYSRPLQLVHRDFDDPVTIIDMRDGSPQAFDSAVDGWMEHEKRTGFDVQQHPLIRFCVHVGSHGVFQLSYSFHHEIIDGWSDALMVTELLRDYFARSSGEDYVPDVPGASFRDAIAQEQAALANPRFRDFWMKEFSDTQLMRLPRLAAPLGADKGDRQIVKFEIPIDDQLSDDLFALARKLAVPVKTVLLAAHMRVMSAMGGGRDTTSYTVGNGRPENADGHRVIGLFVNSLAFRLPMQGGTWRELIRSTLAKEQSVLPFRRFPMAELKRQAGNDPLSETLFFFNHYHVADVLDGRKDAELLGIRVYGESTFPYCVNAYISPVSKRVGMRVEYDSLQFTARLLATMERMYLSVVRSMVANPDARYDLLDVVPEGERNEIVRWSAPTNDMAGVVDVISRIGTLARSQPDAIAVTHEGRHMSYAGLDQLAGRVAAWLTRRGVKPGQLVAIGLPRCIQLPAVIVGVMRAGCPYVPVDPSAPQARVAAILDDARPSCVITTAANLGMYAGAVSLEQLLDELGDLKAIGELDVAPMWPAYVIYTSGTTGKPKGVQVTRGSLALSNNARHTFYPGEHEVFLLLSSIAFDSSIAGLFGTLTAGGTVVMPSGPDALDLTDLLTLIGRHRVTQTLAVPSLYATVLRELRVGPTSLRTVSVAGEAVPSDLVVSHARVLPGVKLVNEYGPTEGTVWATAYVADSTGRAATLPCGLPIPGMRLYVVDAFDYLAPIGVAGEACLAGPMLALGYAGRPAETAQAFRPCEFRARPGERMYRSGDFMRWNAAGQLEFGGRRDAQVKIEGFRIELGEIEAALLKHPKVRNCAVQPRPDATGKQRLVAYVSFNQADADVQELSTHLRALVPRFMLPKAYVALDQLPVSASGKIDRSALPQPAENTHATLVTPRTSTEEVISGIWKMVLGVERLSVHDGFFTVGGDSLRAMRIAAAMQKALGIQPPMHLLMSEGGSVADLAQAIDAARAAGHIADSTGNQDDERDLVRL